MNLYQMGEQYEVAFADLVEQVDSGNLPVEAMVDTIEMLEGELEEKAKNVSVWIKNLEATAKSLKEAEQELAARRKSHESKVTWAKQYLLSNMERTGMTEISCPLWSIKIQKNPTAVQITGEVPEKYLTTKITTAPDKKAIKALIEAGDCDFAELTQSNRLAIK